MTRIRYSKVNNFFVSKEILCGLDLVSITLDPSKMTYMVSKMSTGEVLVTGSAKNMSSLKLLAKKELKKLGVVFDDEVRNKKETVSDTLVGTITDMPF